MPFCAVLNEVCRHFADKPTCGIARSFAASIAEEFRSSTPSFLHSHLQLPSRTTARKGHLAPPGRAAASRWLLESSSVQRAASFWHDQVRSGGQPSRVGTARITNLGTVLRSGRTNLFPRKPTTRTIPPQPCVPAAAHHRDYSSRRELGCGRHTPAKWRKP
jgi:hypothetical protein